MRHVSLRISSLIVTTLALAVVGCAPRGESRTVEQIFADARSSYSSVSSTADSNAGEQLKSVASGLERLAGLGGGGDAKEISAQVASDLSHLTTKAGYTQRVPMNELVLQFRSISTDTGAPASLGNPTLKLLAARTYQLLAAEISTTNFKL